MPRQNFLTKDFFVHASEHQTNHALREIPGFATQISFAGENTLLQSCRFLYTRAQAESQVISVSLLPMNDGHTHVTLHSTYANGHSFTRDPFIANALENFEAALQAALKGEGQSYVARDPKMQRGKKMIGLFMLMLSSIGMVLFWKKMG
jgi:hypothetical protein